MPSRTIKLSAFSGTGCAAGVRRGKKHMSQLAAATRQPLKPSRKRCMCNQHDCKDNCVICLPCWKTAPAQAKKDIYSRQVDVRRAAARVLVEHAFQFNAAYKPQPKQR